MHSCTKRRVAAACPCSAVSHSNRASCLAPSTEYDQRPSMWVVLPNWIVLSVLREEDSVSLVWRGSGRHVLGEREGVLRGMPTRKGYGGNPILSVE